MGIFMEFEDILGRVDSAAYGQRLQEFFDLARDIRARLGRQAYLLDKYISYLLDCANTSMCSESAEAGFTACGALRRLCNEVVSGEDSQMDHTLREQAVAYLAEHPMPHQEQCTKMNILMTALFSESIQPAWDDYTADEEWKLRGVVDMIRVQELHEKICEIIGNEQSMADLDAAIRDTFYGVPASAAFVQGMIQDLLYCLNHRDIESSRQVFQLILDGEFPIAAGGGGDA